MLLKKPENKRRYPRADFPRASYFMLQDKDTAATLECWCSNISMGGISFETDRDDLEDNVIRVLYKVGSLYRRDDLKIKHASHQSSRWKYGCQFVNADYHRNAVINNYVEAKLDR